MKLPAAFLNSPKFQLGLDNRRSFIRDRDVGIIGLRAGLDFEGRARVGFGVYTLSSPFEETLVQKDFLGILDTTRARLRLSYMTAYFGYVLFLTKRWEVSVPVHLGVGDYRYTKLRMDPRTYLMTEAGLSASYRIAPFIGLTGGIGHRVVLAGGAAIRQSFNAATYSLGIKIWTGYILERFMEMRKRRTQSS
jgi:hypothetical protein